MKTTGVFWKFFERVGVFGVQFILQIILARLLSPELYGVLSIMLIFITIANVFIQTGFNTSLIQNKDVTEEDYSSVFWVTLCIAGVLYIIVFVAAPVIGAFFNTRELVTPLRVLALVLFPGALNSVQLAKVSRELDFRRVFFSNIVAILVSGIVGIVMALHGGGLWALVAQYLLNVVIASVVMSVTVNWRPKLVLKFSRIKVLFSFGGKLLISSLIDTLYQNLQSLVVGKKYDSEMLGYYNKGLQFPQSFISVINGTVQTVMLPIMSVEQDDRVQLKQIMRRSITLSAYFVFPLMAGMMAMATPIVQLLLSDKWLPTVPYLQISCLMFALFPVQSCNLQAINAVGRSDIFLRLEIIKKGYGILLLAVAVVFFETPIAIAWTGVIAAVVSSFVNSWPNKKLIGYSYLEQVKDLQPAFLLSVAMYLVVYSVLLLKLPVIYTIAVQFSVGVLVYFALSAIFRVDSFYYLLRFAKERIRKEHI